MRYLLPSIVIIGVGIVTGFIAPSLAETYTPSEVIQRKGLTAVRLIFAAKFIAAALVTGILSALIYVFLVKHWPGVAMPLFIGLGVGMAALFSAVAVFIIPQIELEIDLEGITPHIITLNILWGVCYGIVIPLIMHSKL